MKRDGQNGGENAPTVILQGHLDMVCEKNASTEFDFDKDPIQLDPRGKQSCCFVSTPLSHNIIPARPRLEGDKMLSDDECQGLTQRI